MCQIRPRILPSAHRHGIPDEDILHVYYNAIDIDQTDEDMTMLIGGDRAGRLLEIGVVDSYDEGQVIPHAMKARSKYLRQGRR